MPKFTLGQKIAATMMSTLLGDAMYFHAAKTSLAHAASFRRRLENANAQVANLQGKMDALIGIREDNEEETPLIRSFSNNLESLYFQIEGAEYRLGEAYGPILQGVATTHIVCAASAEAHINIQAQTKLKGREWAAFERLAVDTKWMFLPKLLGLPGFDPGAQP
jgi:hypothetical protein